MSWIPYSPELAVDYTGVPEDELRDRYGDTIWLRLRLDGGYEIKPTLSRHRQLAEVTRIIGAARLAPHPVVGRWAL